DENAGTLDFRADGDDAILSLFVAVNDRIRDRFRHHRLDVRQLFHRRIQLRNEGSDGHPGEGFVFRPAGKLQLHVIAMYLLHSVTPQACKADCSLWSMGRILNSPESSINRYIEGFTAQRIIFPPSWETRLYRPRRTPNPELSIKVSPDRLKTRFVYNPVVSFSSISFRTFSAVWWSNSPANRTTSTFRESVTSTDKPMTFPPRSFTLELLRIFARFLPSDKRTEKSGRSCREKSLFI